MKAHLHVALLACDEEWTAPLLDLRADLAPAGPLVALEAVAQVVRELGGGRGGLDLLVELAEERLLGAGRVLALARAAAQPHSPQTQRLTLEILELRRHREAGEVLPGSAEFGCGAPGVAEPGR